MTAEEFASNIHHHQDGKMYMTGRNLIRFSKKEEPFTFSPILMTEDVYKGVKSANPSSELINKGYLKEQKHPVKNVKSKIYGTSVTWDV